MTFNRWLNIGKWGSLPLYPGDESVTSFITRRADKIGRQGSICFCPQTPLYVPLTQLYSCIPSTSYFIIMAAGIVETWGTLQADKIILQSQYLKKKRKKIFQVVFLSTFLGVFCCCFIFGFFCCCFCSCFFVFLGPHAQHVEVPRLEVESEP